MAQWAPSGSATRDAVVDLPENRKLKRWVARAAEIELSIVRNACAVSRPRPIRAGVAIINFLGNGWIYILVGLAVIIRAGLSAPRVIAAATVGTVFSHLIYKFVKRRTKRLRPFERDASILPVARVLDRYSFPSGHCMTVTAVAVPIIFAIPAWWPAAAVGLLLIAASRLLAGHHYPSDVGSGVLLGILVSVPSSLLILPARI